MAHEIKRKYNLEVSKTSVKRPSQKLQDKGKVARKTIFQGYGIIKQKMGQSTRRNQGT